MEEPYEPKLLQQQYDVRILRALRKIIRAVDMHSRHLHKEFKITTPQLICLHSLNDNGSMTLSQLAKDVSLGMSTTAGIVDRLVAHELASRQQSAQDRRKVVLAITETGKHLIESTPKLLQQQFTDAFGELAEPEQATITLLLEQVVSMMGADGLNSSSNLLPGAKKHLQTSIEEKAIYENTVKTTRTHC